MSTWRSFPEELAEAKVQRPTACPVCKATDLTTTSRTVTASSYWRCLACGEVWNAGRLEAGNRSWPHFR